MSNEWTEIKIKGSYCNNKFSIPDFDTLPTIGVKVIAQHKNGTTWLADWGYNIAGPFWRCYELSMKRHYLECLLQGGTNLDIDSCLTTVMECNIGDILLWKHPFISLPEACKSAYKEHKEQIRRTEGQIESLKTKMELARREMNDYFLQISIG